MAISALSSISTLARLTVPLCSSITFSIRGNNTLHGPHHLKEYVPNIFNCPILKYKDLN